MSEGKKKKYGRVAKITGMFIGLVLVLEISYAVFKTTSRGEKINRINTADFNVVITNESEKTILFENAVPTLSGKGQQQEPYTFDVENKGSVAANYKLYLEASSTSDLPSNKIKYNLVRKSDVKQVLTMLENLNEDNTEPIGTASEEDRIAFQTSSLLSSTDVVNEDGKTLYVIDLGTIGPKKKQSYELKMWIAYAAGTEVINKNFEAKVRVDAEQTGQDDAYPIEQYDITEDSDYKKQGFQTYIGFYSDGSIRFSGIGPVSFDNSKMQSLTVMTLGIDKENLLRECNKILKKYNEEEFSDLNLLFESLSGEENTYSDEILDEINTALENARVLFNGSVYFEDGITLLDGNNNGIFNSFFINNSIEKIYISKTVGAMKNVPFRNSENIKEIYFTAIKEKTKSSLVTSLSLTSPYAFWGNSLTKIEFQDNLVSLGSAAIYNCPNLKTLTLPASVIHINDKAIQGCSNLDLKILAKQSEVEVMDRYNQNTNLKLEVKSVTWVNG